MRDQDQIQWVLLLLIIFGVILPACNNPILGEPPPTPDPDLIVQQAADNLMDLESVHFSMDISGRLTYLDYPPTLALKYVEGDITKPDKMQAVVKISSFGTITEVAIKEVDGRQYITNPLNQQWETVSKTDKWYFNPAYFFDSEQGLANLIQRTDWDFFPDIDTERKNTTFFSKVIDGSELYSISSGMITEGEVRVEIWISEKTLTLSSIRLTEIESDPEDPTIWEIELEEHQEPVEITEPELYP